MKTIQAANQQSILDLAMQHCGAAEAAMPIAALNGLPLDAALTPGQPLLIPEPTDGRVVAQLARQGVAPATAWVPEPEPEDPNALRVVGYELHLNPNVFLGTISWGVNGNFIVANIISVMFSPVEIKMIFNRPLKEGDAFRITYGITNSSNMVLPLNFFVALKRYVFTNQHSWLFGSPPAYVHGDYYITSEDSFGSEIFFYITGNFAPGAWVEGLFQFNPL